jgi:hypothetical protein
MTTSNNSQEFYKEKIVANMNLRSDIANLKLDFL